MLYPFDNFNNSMQLCNAVISYTKDGKVHTNTIKNAAENQEFLKMIVSADIINIKGLGRFKVNGRPSYIYAKSIDNFRTSLYTLKIWLYEVKENAN